MCLQLSWETTGMAPNIIFGEETSLNLDANFEIKKKKEKQIHCRFKEKKYNRIMETGKHI